MRNTQRLQDILHHSDFYDTILHHMIDVIQHSTSLDEDERREAEVYGGSRCVQS